MRNKIRMIAYDAILIAIIILFTFVDYLGYINLGVISFTTIHIIVLIGASLFGYKRGMIYGFIFGLSSLLKALSYPGTANYFFINPFVSILPRVLFGFLAGLTFDLFKKYFSQKTFNILVAPASGVLTFIHTLLTMLCLYLFGILDPFKISAALGLTPLIENGEIMATLISFISIGSVCEIIAAALLTGGIYLIISKNFKIGLVSEGNFKRKNIETNKNVEKPNSMDN